MNKIILKFIILLWLSSLSSLVLSEAESIDDRIKILREEYIQDKKRNDIIKEVEKKAKLNKVYIRAHKVEQECLKLGIDCETGGTLPEKKQIKTAKTVNEHISEIQAQQRLIQAKKALAKEKEYYCKLQGLTNCSVTQGGERVKELPKAPTLIGFLDNEALFRVRGRIQAYTIDDMVENQYQIKSISAEHLVTLTHPDSYNDIAITLK